MIVAGQRLAIVVATRPVDFRCGHQTLALIVQEQLKLIRTPNGYLPVETRRQAEDPGLGRQRSGADLQAPGTRQLRLAEDPGRGYASVSGAIRGSVRGSGLASGRGAAGGAAICGRLTHRVDFDLVLLGFLSRIG